MKKHLFFLGLIFFAFNAKSQSINAELIGSSGDNFKNSTFQIDWSIGEVLTETYSGNQISLTQGFHQGYYNITVIKEISDIQFTLIAFPNPTSDFINIKVESGKNEDLSFNVCDISGKLLQQGTVVNNCKQIDFSDFPCGTYILSIFQNNQSIKTFQIIKN